MRSNLFVQWLILLCIFILALVMEIMPWPIEFQGFRPAWLVMVLTYWIMAIPNKISIGSAFALGVLWDLVLGSTLGTHALVLSVFAYLIAANHLILRNFSLWQQSLLVMMFVAVIRISIFLVELFLHSAIFNWQELIGALISGLLWPWLFLLLRKIRRQAHLR
ncbi:rod shape-determining protein MreD [Conservatibacter flavescens]|uniref:Rod shape-determining protein MreD n=1 Tax=Conservatibacter flavescens TaxID=28161 RepID=A0A2M8S3S3_9PAST|nr:rod shape-determining protein MreD [Conservatibacter flavescens]PJG85793.1 rod shape-determining protein MreD [Conservatibacter flavescens]